MNNNDETNKIQYLQMIQSGISRMATSSALFKGFSATIVAGISAVAYDQQSVVVIMLSFLPVIVFACLDIYYLQLERKMRYIYRMVREGVFECDFDMEIEIDKRDYKEARMRIRDCITSKSILIFYPAMIAILAIVLGMKIGGVI